MKRPIPKYFTIRAILEARLEREHAPGDRLPSEAALCAEFSVSRVTIQQALALLETDGLVAREQGRGTFYRGPRPGRSETEPSRLLESLVARPPGAFARLLGTRTVIAPPRVAARLKLPDGAPVLAIERVGFVDDEPIIFIKAYLPPDLGAALAEDGSALTRTTLAAFLRERCGVEVDTVLQTIGATLADPAFAGHLGVEAGAPVLEGERTYFDRRGRPVAFSDAFYRADRHRFVVPLKDWR